MQRHVDIVYRWIDPAAGAAKLLDVLSTGATPARAEMSVVRRYRDNGELRYSLRAVARHAPWFNAIHILGEGAPPVWLKTNSPIFWTDILSLQLSQGQEPQLNSETQKLYYLAIPGLAEKFICFDDDWFFGDNVSESDFFTAKGMPIQPSLCPEYGGHAPVAWTRTLYAIALGMMPRAHLTSIKAGGTARTDPWLFMRRWLAANRLVTTSMDRNAQIWLRDTNVQHYRDILQDIEDVRPTSYCINDDWSLDASEYLQQRENLQKFFKSMYPVAPSWERSE